MAPTLDLTDHIERLFLKNRGHITAEGLGASNISVRHAAAHPFSREEYHDFLGSWYNLQQRYPKVVANISHMRFGGDTMMESILSRANQFSPNATGLHMPSGMVFKGTSVSRSGLAFNVPAMRSGGASLDSMLEEAPEEMVDRVRDWSKKIPFKQYSGFGDILTHEFGHAVEHASHGPYEDQEQMIEKLALKTRPEWFAKVTDRLVGFHVPNPFDFENEDVDYEAVMEQAQKMVSKVPEWAPSIYGSDQGTESFAEAFADVTLHDKPLPQSRVMMEVHNERPGVVPVDLRGPNSPPQHSANTGLRRKDQLSQMLNTRRIYGFR